MRRVFTGLLWPVAFVGGALGVGYLIITGRHPSPTVLMLLGVVGVLAVAWSALHLISLYRAM